MTEHTLENGSLLTMLDDGGALISSKHDVVELSAGDVAAIRGPGFDAAKLLEWLGERASIQRTGMESSAYLAVVEHVRGMASEPAPRVSELPEGAYLVALERLVGKHLEQTGPCDGRCPDDDDEAYCDDPDCSYCAIARHMDTRASVPPTSSPGTCRGEGSTHVGPGCQPNPSDSLLGVEESGGVFRSTEGEPQGGPPTLVNVANAENAIRAIRGRLDTNATDEVARFVARVRGELERPELSHCGECDKQTRFGTQQTCRECESMRLVDAPPEWLVELEKLAPGRGHIGRWVLTVVTRAVELDSDLAAAEERIRELEEQRGPDLISGGADRLKSEIAAARAGAFREMSEFLKSATHEEGAAKPKEVCPAAIDFQGAKVACRLGPGHGLPHVGPSKTHGDLSWVDDALDKMIREGQVKR